MNNYRNGSHLTNHCIYKKYRKLKGKTNIGKLVVIYREDMHCVCIWNTVG